MGQFIALGWRKLMTMKTHALLVLVLALAAFHAEAATITPASPTSQDVINATIDVFSTTSYNFPSTSVSGNVIRTNLPVLGFDPGPPAFTAHIFVSFGPLPPGTYVYQVYNVFDGQPALLSQQTIIVAPAIPTMNSFYLSILAIFLAVIGWFMAGKHA
jgi:hypothetical protein